MLLLSVLIFPLRKTQLQESCWVRKAFALSFLVDFASVILSAILSLPLFRISFLLRIFFVRCNLIINIIFLNESLLKTLDLTFKADLAFFMVRLKS